MKKKSFLVMAIAVCCAVNYSCTSDFEDEAVVPAAKRTTAQAWSPEVLQRARELGIIIVDEDRQWNNLTDEDVVFYLNLLTEKGDSAFTLAVAPAPKPMGMLRRMSGNMVEDVGSTVHDNTYFKEFECMENTIRYTVSVSFSWGVQDGKIVNPIGNYGIQFEDTGIWEVSGSSLNLSYTLGSQSINYNVDGPVYLVEKAPKGDEEPRTQTFWVHVKGTASV